MNESFDITKIILILFSVSLIIGGLDYLRGNRWKLGERFCEGIRAFEPLFLTMAGIIVLIPCLQKILTPVLPPVCEFLGLDPALFAGIFIANDMGGYPLAHALTSDKNAADFSGMLLGSVMGVNLVFTLPAALKMIRKEDQQYLFKGMLYGFITLPVGCLAGGLAAGYPVMFLLKMLIPTCIIAFCSAFSLKFFPQKITAALSRLGRGIEILAVLGIVLAISAELTGVSTGGFLEPIQEGLKVVGSIVIVLPGAYVFMELLNRGFRKFFLRTGALLGINETSVLGMITTLANSIPTFLMIEKMDPKGKLLNFAFLTGGAFAFGDHLAFCCAVAPDLAFPLVITKITAAFSALILTWLIYRKKS